MTVEDGKYEVYVIGYNTSDYINKNYIEEILSENNFNLCKNIEYADFILDTKDFLNTPDSAFALEYAEINYVEVAETIYDLLRFRENSEFSESWVR